MRSGHSNPARSGRARLVALVGVALLGACAAPGGDTASSTASTPPTTGTVAAEPVQLRYEPGVPEVTVSTATLRCGAEPETTGYLAARPAGPACEALDAALVEPAPDQQCTQIYGGPQRLIITVPPPTPSGPTRRVEIDRSDGCAITRFDAAGALLPPGAGREDWIG